MADEKDRGYPLTWPAGLQRTPPSKRAHAKFKVHFSRARSDLIEELRRLGASGTCFSSNVPRRADGQPYAEDRKIDDPGVAVYFDRGGKEMAIACDRYLLVKDNLRAIGLVVEAIRAIERNGSSSLMEQAFRGFAALPPASASWPDVLCVERDDSLEVIKASYRALALQHHPDHGGSAEKMAELAQAYEQAMKERGV